MDKILGLLPKGILVTLAIVGGIFLIILIDPPKTVCKAQVDVIKESQKKFLEKDPKSKLEKYTTRYEKMRDTCKVTNSPGGCYELFQEVRKLLYDLSTLTSDCSSAAGGEAAIKRVLWETAQLLVELAWGEKPPSAYHAKFGWLDTADISLFCKIKGRIVAIYGEPQWNTFREKMMNTLPGAGDMVKVGQRTQVWDMSIFSENCARYP